MATFYFDGDSLQQCPYNPYHRVLSRRLLSHMSKCAEDPNSPKLKECPFNSLHRVYPDELDTHIVECRDNRQVIREMFNPVDNAPSSSAPQPRAENIDDGWDTDTEVKDYVLPGLEDKEVKDNDDENNEEFDNDGFISQQKLYNLKPAERKRLYNQLTENVIKRQAQQERQELTAEEARELGLDVKPKVEFMVDPKGEPSTSGEERNNTDEEDSTAPKRPRLSSEFLTDSGEVRQKIKKTPDEDEEDNKEHVKKLLRASEPGCFKSRLVDRRKPM